MIKDRPGSQYLLSLTGGLGNQLFQLAAALYFAKGETIEVLQCFGAPRSTNGRADLLHFHLPENVIINEKVNSFILAKKVSGYMLRKGINPTGVERYRLYNATCQIMASSYMSLYLSRKLKVFASDDVGFTENHPIKNSLLLGYFQSYRYAINSDIKSCIRLYSEYQSSYFIDARNRISELRPIIVHMRFKDYVNEPKFGMPDLDYYSKAIEYAITSVGIRPIWIFSDDNEMAKDKFIESKKLETVYFDSKDLTPAAVLELMRFGSAYVIANSTFSWWSAYLAYAETPTVVAPRTWFKNLREPRDIIPNSWKTL